MSRAEVAALQVGGQTITNWTGLTIQRSLDDVTDAFSFSAAFHPDMIALRNAFRPIGYQPALVLVDDELIMTARLEQVEAGTMEGINLQGRSPAGSMVDCAFEPPYQFDGQRWGAIASKIAAPFGVLVDRTTNTGPIKEAKASTGDTAAGFLLSLAQGEGYLMNSSPAGALRLQKVTRKAPVASLVEGVGSLVSARLMANGTERFSTTKAVKSMGGWEDVAATSRDAGVKIHRPRIISTDGNPNAVQAAADWARSQSIAASCLVDVVVTGWANDAGRIWEPGDFVTLKAPSAWILTDWLFVVASVTLELSNGGRSTSMRLALPEAYLGGVPGGYPWD